METLCKIRNLARAIMEYENNFLLGLSLSLNEAMLLCSLSGNENITSGDLAEDLCLTCSNTSKLIKSLEDKGLLFRSFDREDKRKTVIKITEKGKNKLKEISIDSDENIPEILKLYLHFLNTEENKNPKSNKN